VEGLCRPLGRSVLISVSVAAETTAPPVPLGEHPLRGIAAPCAVFTCRTGERLGWVQVASPTSHRPSPALLSLEMNELARRCFSLPEDRAISVDPARRIRCFHGALD